MWFFLVAIEVERLYTQKMINRWMYIDFNSYFASVEQQLRPELRKKPIVVIPVESDFTCAIAASYEAKAFGIKTGTPVWEAKKLCPGLICVLAQHEMYVEFHEKIVKEINRYVPVATICSIDEVACKLMDNESVHAEKLAEKIKEGLKQNIGICMTCSIGIAPNKYLAKVASDMKKPNGLVFLNQQDLPQKLYSLKLRDLPGIGANMELRLHRFGIRNMEALCALDLKQLRSAWGSVEGERMWHHLRGIDLPDRETKRKSLGHSHVIAPEWRYPQKACAIGKKLTIKAASRLRRMGFVASAISLSVSLEEDFFELSLCCHRVSDNFTFLALFNQMWEKMISQTKSSKIKKIGVTFFDLEEQINQQPELFCDCSRDKEEKVSHVLDVINQKYGKDSISLGFLPKDGKTFSNTKIAFTRIPEKEEFFE